MPSFTDVNPNDPATAATIQQVVDALKGTPSKGIPLSVTSVNDSLNYAISIKNGDAGASRALIVYKADSTVLLQIDKNGVQASPDGTLAASQLATLTGAQTFTGKIFQSPAFLGTCDFSVAGVVLKVPFILTTAGGASLTLPITTDTLVGRATTDTLTNKTLQDPQFLGQVTMGTGVQTLPTITGNAGKWRFFKALTAAMTITPATGEALQGPGEQAPRAVNATYTSPAGESSGWYCNGANWVFI